MTDQIAGFNNVQGSTQGVGTFPSQQRAMIREQMLNAAVEEAPATLPTSEEAAPRSWLGWQSEHLYPGRQSCGGLQ